MAVVWWRWCGGGGAAVVQNGELQEHGGVEDGEAGWEGGLARTAPGSTGVDLPHLRSVCGADCKGCGERVQSACCAERVQSTCKARAELVRSGCSVGAVRHRHEVVPLGLEPREQVGDVRVLDEHVGIEEDGLVVRGAREQQRLLEPALKKEMIVVDHPVQVQAHAMRIWHVRTWYIQIIWSAAVSIASVRVSLTRAESSLGTCTAKPAMSSRMIRTSGRNLRRLAADDATMLRNARWKVGLRLPCVTTYTATHPPRSGLLRKHRDASVCASARRSVGSVACMPQRNFRRKLETCTLGRGGVEAEVSSTQ